jgi:cytochrome c-type biogenesis protein CcmE
MSEIWIRRFAGGFAILLAASALVGLSYGNLGQNLVYYWSPTELHANADKAVGATVRLGGLVVPGTFDMKKCNPGCNFRVTDGQNEVLVESTGLPPQMFREGIGVVVEGQYDGAVFHTDRVMVKHSNEYRAPEDGKEPDFAKTLTEGTE